MPLTYLTNNEKFRSLMYVSNNEISSDADVKKKQYEILGVFWRNYIKENDYYPYVRIIEDKKYGIVYTFDWACEDSKNQIQKSQ